MNWRVHTPVAAAVAIVSGGLVLASLLIPGLDEARNRVLNWAILLAALGLLLGLANLFRVHWEKLRNRQNPAYSGVLIAAMLVTFAVTLWEGSRAELPSWIFNNIQVPIETSLMAVLAASLTLAAARMFQKRSDRISLTFGIALFIILLGSGPLFGMEIPFFTRTLTPIVSGFLAAGALRGLLIGVALGTLLTGLRVLVGADRPYGG
ncbi:MAG: hypothetical protein KIS85_01430 [Anaerolineales bacterium]|nr:hypothetical protein [Anaerolineales bacterium]